MMVNIIKLGYRCRTELNLSLSLSTRDVDAKISSLLIFPVPTTLFS